MSKRQKYKIGDIFTIPLKEDLVGYARILRKLGDSIVVECFDIEKYEKNKELKIIGTQCCWDTAIKKKEWVVIDFKEVKENYKIPDFKTTMEELRLKNKHDINSGTEFVKVYFKISGETILTGYDGGEKREYITKEEFYEDEIMEEYGVNNEKGLIYYYLEKINLL